MRTLPHGQPDSVASWPKSQAARGTIGDNSLVVLAGDRLPIQSAWRRSSVMRFVRIPGVDIRSLRSPQAFLRSDVVAAAKVDDTHTNIHLAEDGAHRADRSTHATCDGGNGCEFCFSSLWRLSPNELLSASQYVENTHQAPAHRIGLSTTVVVEHHDDID